MSERVRVRVQAFGLWRADDVRRADQVSERVRARVQAFELWRADDIRRAQKRGTMSEKDAAVEFWISLASKFKPANS